MMIRDYDRGSKNVVVTCDGCEEELEVLTSDFSEASKVIRDKKWTIKKLHNDWLHLCPKCSNREVFKK